MSKRDPNRPNWGDPKHFQMFSQPRIDLHQEIKLHPILVDLIQKHPQDEFEIILAETSAYCGVVLKGDYTPQDLDGLCEVLYHKLVYRRTGLQIAGGTTVSDES